MKLIKRKRIMAFALALALVFSLVPSVKSRAASYSREDYAPIMILMDGTVLADYDAEEYYNEHGDFPSVWNEDCVCGFYGSVSFDSVTVNSSSKVITFTNLVSSGEEMSYAHSGWTFVFNGTCRTNITMEEGTATFSLTPGSTLTCGSLFAPFGLTLSEGTSVTPADLDLTNVNGSNVTFSGEEAAPVVYTIKFETGEGSKVDLQEVEGGSKATKPSTNPTRTGYTFGGWYADEDWKTEFDFSKAITTDTTVYAKWVAEEKKASYTILNGKDQTIETEAGKDLEVRASGEVAKFTALKIDGKEVDKANYTITEGSTIAKIKAAFLDTLTEGEHTLTFVYTDGDVSTGFTTKKHTTDAASTTPAEVTTPSTTEAAKKTTDTSPKTGDSLPVVPLAALMVVSLAGIFVLKKSKAN